MSAHDVTVVEGTALLWAQCTCGWIGPSQPSRAKAELDAAQHRVDAEDDDA